MDIKNNHKPNFIWSNTDFPYMCLLDYSRTMAFQQAIRSAIQKDDIVVDVGAGSGILSLFAASMGAKKVYAVEIDHFLVEALKKTITANKFNSIIEVIEGNILDVELPKKVDLVLAEIIDTGLFDEMQLPVLNHLRKTNVISAKTKIVPQKYSTFMNLVNCDNYFYGFQIFAPRHDWPFYEIKNSGWHQSKFTNVSESICIANYNFMSGIIQEFIDKTVSFRLKNNTTANAIRISGKIGLWNDLTLGPTNALNGDKIIAIDPIIDKTEVNLRIKSQAGMGLGQLQIDLIN